MFSRFLQKLIASSVSLRYGIDEKLYRQSSETAIAFEKYRGMARGKPIMVVGNGPSLNDTPLEDFSGVPSIGMNKIDRLYQRSSWRPTLVVCVNNIVVRQNRPVFEHTDIPTFLAWKTRWFMGRSNNPQLHYFNSRPTLEFSDDVSEWVAGLSPTVSYTALQFAHFLGGDPVVLFGIDHQFDTDPNDSGIVRRRGIDRNHFDPDYFKSGQYWGLPDLAGSEQSYLVAKQVFERSGRKILDATVGGQLSVFQKISIDEARSLLLENPNGL